MRAPRAATAPTAWDSTITYRLMKMTNGTLSRHVVMPGIETPTHSSAPTVWNEAQIWG